MKSPEHGDPVHGRQTSTSNNKGLMPMKKTLTTLRIRVSHSLAIIFCALLALSFCVFAQDTVPGTLSGVGTSGSQAVSAALNKSAAPADRSATPQVSPPAVPAAPANDPGPFWALQAVRLVGDLEFAEAQGLQAKVESALLTGVKVSLVSADAALAGLRKDLVEAGYYLASLSLPPGAYDEATQTLTLRVGAGYIGKVSVAFPERDGEDGRWFSTAQIERRFSDFTTNEVFNYRRLHRRLSEINGHPDLTLDTQIKVRSVIEGEKDARRVERYADLNFTAKESRPFHAMLEVNNYATDELDNWQSQLTLQYLNLTRADDVLTVSPGITLNGNLWSVATSYMRPHQLHKGGATTIYGGYSDLESDNVVPHIDLEGTGWFAGLVESFKLIDTEGSLLSLSGGILYRYIEDQFSAHLNNQSLTLQARNASVLPLTVSLSYSDREADALRGRNFITLSGIYNLWAGGDSGLDKMWYGAEEHYTIARLQVARLQPLFASRDAKSNPIHQWTLFLKAETQWSPDPLIPAEKLFLGGFNTVRGYTPKCVLGDSGIYGTAELRTPILLDTVTHLFRSKEKAATPIDRAQFLVFLDAAYTKMEDPLPGAIESETMLSTGFGLRLALTPYSQFRFDYGIPLIDIDSDDDSSGAFYVSGQLQF